MGIRWRAMRLQVQRVVVVVLQEKVGLLVPSLRASLAASHVAKVLVAGRVRVVVLGRQQSVLMLLR